MEGVVAPHAPQVEGQRHDDHGDGDEIELRGGELAPAGAASPASYSAAITPTTVPPGSAVLPDALGDASLSVEGSRCRAAPPPRRSSASPAHRRSAPPGSGSSPRGWAPRPVAISQARATWLGVRSVVGLADPPESATTASTCSIGWAEKVRPRRGVGGRVLAREPPLADRRVGERHHAELAAACRSARPVAAWRAAGRTRSGCWPAAGRVCAARASIDAHLLSRVVRDADRLAPGPRPALRRAPRPGASCERSEIGPWIWYRSIVSQPRRSSESRAAAERSAACTFSFHGLGMNFVAITTRARTPGSASRRRPMMRSLSPWP